MAEASEEDVELLYNAIHYWCSTFTGRYDVWQFAIPESDKLLNEYGAFAFGYTRDDNCFYRVPAFDTATMQPMSYYFTAYDAKTFEILPLANDRIEIVVYDQSQTTGIENIVVNPDADNVQRSMVNCHSYNLNGQKVSDSYRGIVIKKGRKIVRR